MIFEIYKMDKEWVLSIGLGSNIFHRDTLAEIIEIVKEKLVSQIP